MWHAFDIIADAMRVEHDLRSAEPDNARSLVYSERIVRWFKDKSGEGQWPAVIDERPGIRIDRSPPTENTGDKQALDIEHTSLQGTSVSMRMRLEYSADPWRSPSRWHLTETLGDSQSPSELRDTTEYGNWTGKQITRSIQGSAGRVIEHHYPAGAPSCLYTLLASFPLNKDTDHPACDALFTEGMQHVGGAVFMKGSTGNAGEHALAEGLICYRLIPELGFPLEFWVNEYGLVVYLVEGATRAWVLRGMEAQA